MNTLPVISFALLIACLPLQITALEPLPLMEPVTVSGLAIPGKNTPEGLVLRNDMGLLTVSSVDGQVVHRTQTRILETRAIITPNGDYLLMFPEGDHYAKSKGEKINTMMACRSTDKGKTWSAPGVAYDIPYSQHGFIPFMPRGTKRIYAFGTQPIAGHWTPAGGQRENAAIGYRWSDDNGHTWSDVKLIAPVNDPGFRGMSVMRMTETDSGTWLLGSHIADWSVKPIKTKQYLLRSEDKGATWTVLPDARPNGWFAKGFDRMDEGRPLNLGGGRVLFMTRTPAGHLFTAWSKDDGKTWTKPAPSSLVHPDAPPMLFPLSDGKTLVAFHHNKVPPTNPQDLNDHAETMKVRSEVWVSTSTDEGHTWSEPRFVLANAVESNLKVGGFNFQCSYIDAFVEDGVMHLFMPHRWQQALHLTIKESDFATLPTKAELAKFKGVKAASKSASANTIPQTKPTAKKPEPNYASKLAADIKPTRRVIYKKIGDVGLGLDIFEPAGFKKSDKRACFVSIHGGGWTGGSPRSMYPFTDHCAKLGMVAISVQYRFYKPGGDLTVFDCVKDARAALRYVRAHAEELGIDPDKIVANGASAGGHLAVATALFVGVDHPDENLLVSCCPNALILFSPVIDTSNEGYGQAKVGDRWEELSPAHQVRRAMPPTLHFHGTGDTTTPFKGAHLFETAMRKAGNNIELVAPPDAIHTYMFKDATLYAETLKKMDVFLKVLGVYSPLRTGPPLGLKTYRDLGLTVDETMLARPVSDASVKRPGPLKTLAVGEQVYPLFDPNNQVRFALKDAREIWCAYSKDKGNHWSEPRFVCRIEAGYGNDATELRILAVRKVSGKALQLTLETDTGSSCEVSFKEDDLCRLATQADLDNAPAGNLVIHSTLAAKSPAETDVLTDSLCVGGDIRFDIKHPPEGYRVSTELGLVVFNDMSGQVIHRGSSDATTLYETRGFVAPGGDYVVMIPDGRHANSPRADANVMVEYRSCDQGKTWRGPTLPFGDQEKHHAALPLISTDGRVYLFGTQRGPSVATAKRDRAFGFRYSDDEARTWSPVELIRLTDGKFFGGAGVIQPTRTEVGTWMCGFHHAKILRSQLENGQRSWTVVTPEGTPEPGSLAALYHQDELRVLGLKGSEVMTQARTCEGHLWQMRSSDDGRTWTQGTPTSLVHPDAPPMMFTLSDGQTLIALHHNRAVMRSVHEPVHSQWLKMPAPSEAEIQTRNRHKHSLKDWVSRAEVWFSLSTDGGRNWDEPRLLFANALAETLDHANPNYQCSYVDLFVDKGRVHLFIPHRWQRVVHLSFQESDLGRFQTREQLRHLLSRL